MSLKELEKTVQEGENLYVEFKHKISQPDKFANEMVAFANTLGGTILVGVDDNKSIYGLKNVDEEIYTLKNVVEKYFKYPIEYRIEKIQNHPKKHVLAVIIPEADKKPKFALQKPHQKYGLAYVRVADMCVQASKEMIQILRMQNKGSKISLNKTESSILRLFALNHTLTKKQIIENTLLSENIVSTDLVRLVVAGILAIEPGRNGEDVFTQK